MVIEAFPPLDEADEDGLLAVGGDLEPASLALAYRSGIFPWPIGHDVLAWFSPPTRCVLNLCDLHVSKSLARALSRTNFRFEIDKDFLAVITQCAATKRPKQRGTWITTDIVGAYCELHERGIAHSFECYEGDELVGGLYGVSFGGMFAAESMFHRRENSSKMVMVFMRDELQKRGATWIDAQVMNPFLKQMGFVEIPRDEFVKKLGKALKAAPLWPP